VLIRFQGSLNIDNYGLALEGRGTERQTSTKPKAVHAVCFLITDKPAQWDGKSP